MDRHAGLTRRARIQADIALIGASQCGPRALQLRLQEVANGRKASERWYHFGACGGGMSAFATEGDTTEVTLEFQHREPAQETHRALRAHLDEFQAIADVTYREYGPRDQATVQVVLHAH